MIKSFERIFLSLPRIINYATLSDIGVCFELFPYRHVIEAKMICDYNA